MTDETFLAWTPFERDGDLWVKYANGEQRCLGPIEPACEKWAGFLAERDFGEGARGLAAD